jgi:DNA-binding LacI/PurR family transcriptional regulator
MDKVSRQPSNKQRTTRQEVAKHANVSVAVVSYVVNNGPRPVAAATRSRVEQSIKELGYYPNELARNLRRQNSLTIGLVIPSVANAVYAEIAEGLDRVCVANGYQLLLLDSHHDTKREKRLVQLLRSKQVDGVVIQPTQDPRPLIKPLLEAHIPVVLIEHDVPNAHCITLSDVEGGRLATEHLLKLGHKRIAIIREKPLGSLSYQRFEGYQHALLKYKAPFDPNLVVAIDSINHEAGCAAMQQLLALKNPPTAVFTHNDVLALGAMHAIKEAGLNIPEDISVVGYDDIRSAAYFSPPLTTVRLAKHELGREAGRIVLEHIKSSTSSFQKVVLPVELVVRASTSVPGKASSTKKGRQAM